MTLQIGNKNHYSLNKLCIKMLAIYIIVQNFKLNVN